MVHGMCSSTYSRSIKPPRSAARTLHMVCHCPASTERRYSSGVPLAARRYSAYLQSKREIYQSLACIYKAEMRDKTYIVRLGLGSVLQS